MTFSKLDSIYRSILLSKYFIKGWGSPEHFKRLLEFRKVVSCRDTCFKLVGEYYPIEITKDEFEGDIHIINGRFQSPFDFYLPSLLPKESKVAYFQMVIPKNWADKNFKPVCIHMAGTGDQTFWRRRNLMAKPLLREAGIGSILLENPFYGARKPSYQLRSVLNNVSDIFVMGGCLILEALTLFHWCKRQGFGPLGVTGLSMGGHMASLAATNWPYPLVLVPCLSWSTASVVFTEGVMSKAINWDLLESQYKENMQFRNEIQRMVQISESDAYQAGIEFVKNFSHNILHFNDKETQTDIRADSVASDLLLNNKEGNFVDNDRLFISGNKKEHMSPVPKYENVQSIKKNSSTRESSSQLVKSINRVLSSFHWRSSCAYEATNFMKGIMDECTHLKNFSVPVDTSLIIFVCARYDGYVPREGVSDLSDIWPGAEVRYVDAGHVSAFVMHRKEFHQAIIEAFQRYRRKYINDESWLTV